MTLDEKLENEKIEPKGTRKATALRHAGYFGIGFAAGVCVEMIYGPSSNTLSGAGFIGFWNGINEVRTREDLKRKANFIYKLGYCMSTVPSTVSGYVAGIYLTKGFKNLF